MYGAGLPDGWLALDPPSFRTSRGSLDRYRSWLLDEIGRRGSRVVLAGHSMGAALALLAAAETDRVAALLLIAPAGLPLTKPISRSATDFVGQLAAGRFPLRHVRAGARAALGSPRSALRVACAVRRLDLAPELEAIRRRRVPVTVVGCPTDTLVPPAHCRRIAELGGGR